MGKLNLVRIHLDTGLGADILIGADYDELMDQIDGCISRKEKFVEFVGVESPTNDSPVKIAMEPGRIIAVVHRDFQVFKAEQERMARENMLAGGDRG